MKNNNMNRPFGLIQKNMKINDKENNENAY